MLNKNKFILLALLVCFKSPKTNNVVCVFPAAKLNKIKRATEIHETNPNFIS